ncbi:MAG: hypothetical protein U9Q37_10700 [Euryarchaeota archaeon]|nr:hypothetical protein [Euryarchaeota archaeon]
MNENKLVEITPKEWGLLVYLSEIGIIDLDDVKAAIKDVSNYRIVFAETILETCKNFVEEF